MLDSTRAKLYIVLGLVQVLPSPHQEVSWQILFLALCAHRFLLLMLARVLQPDKPSELLSATDAATDSAATTEYTDFNNLRNFGVAFPPGLQLTEHLCSSKLFHSIAVFIATYFPSLRIFCNLILLF